MTEQDEAAATRFADLWARTCSIAAMLAAGILLTGCSVMLGGTSATQSAAPVGSQTSSSYETPVQPSSENPSGGSGATAGSDATAAVLAMPCQLLSAQQAAQLQLRTQGKGKDTSHSHECGWPFADDSIGELSVIEMMDTALSDLPDVGKQSPITVGRHSGLRVAEILSPDDCEVDLSVATKLTLRVLVTGGGTSDAACSRTLQGAQIVEAELP